MLSDLTIFFAYVLAGFGLIFIVLPVIIFCLVKAAVVAFYVARKGFRESEAKEVQKNSGRTKSTNGPFSIN